MEVHTERMCKHCDHPEICHDLGGTFSNGECMLHIGLKDKPASIPCPCPGFEPAEGTS